MTETPNPSAPGKIKTAARNRSAGDAKQKRRIRLPKQDRAQTASAALDVEAYRYGARARAILRGAEIRRQDLQAAGGAFNLEDVQNLLHGVSRQRIEKQVRDLSLLAVPGPSNRRVYPVVQFDEDGSVIGGLRAVQQAFPSRNPWMILNFLIRGDARLGGRKPIDLLKDGQVAPVVEAARHVGLQGG